MPTQHPSRHSELSDYTAVPLSSQPTEDTAPPTNQPQTPAAPYPIIIHYKAMLQGLKVRASLLPSLKAQYTVSTRETCTLAVFLNIFY